MYLLQYLGLGCYSKPLYSNGFSHTYSYSKYGIAHFVFKEVAEEFLNYDVFLSLKVVLIFTNSADPDLGLHCCQSTHLGVSSILRVKLLPIYHLRQIIGHIPT